MSTSLPELEQKYLRYLACEMVVEENKPFDSLSDYVLDDYNGRSVEKDLYMLFDSNVKFLRYLNVSCHNLITCLSAALVGENHIRGNVIDGFIFGFPNVEFTQTDEEAHFTIDMLHEIELKNVPETINEITD